MNEQAATLEEVVEAIKAMYPVEDRFGVAVAYAGNKVEYEGEIWYEITISDGSGQVTEWCWCSAMFGSLDVYDGERLDPADRIPEIEAKLGRN